MTTPAPTQTPPQAPTATEFRAVESQFQREAAVVAARPLLAQAFFVAWVVLDAALIAFAVYAVVGYIVNGSFTEMRSIATIGANAGVTHVSSTNAAAEDLVIGSARVLKSGEGAYDAYVTLENPNTDWYATFDYAFDLAGESTDTYEGFILPGEEKYVIALNEKPDTRPASADVTISNITWHRVDRHQVPRIEAWLDSHRDFSVETSSYASDVALENDTLGRSVFTVKNASPYSYWNPKFTVVLERNGSIVGLHQATVSKFAAGETREVAVHWSGEAPLSADATLIPNINFFDVDAYMSPEGFQGIDVRDLFIIE